MQQLQITTSQHTELQDITAKIQSSIPDDYTGSLLIYTPHTTVAIMVNEGADPAVQGDIIAMLEHLVPWKYETFQHAEGNSAAHIKAMLVGNDQMLIVNQGRLQLGTWEKIFFCEFDGPRTRKIWVQLHQS